MKNNHIWVVEGIRAERAKSIAAYSTRKAARLDQREQREIGVKNTKIKKYITLQ
jgi:hypothetical protein